jgi:hypothetical protein
MRLKVILHGGSPIASIFTKVMSSIAFLAYEFQALITPSTGYHCPLMNVKESINSLLQMGRLLLGTVLPVIITGK